MVAGGATAQEVGQHFGITRERVRQIVRRELNTTIRALQPPKGRPPRVDRESRTIRRFWARVRVDESGCWIYTGALMPTGYGHSSRNGYAHREAYEAVNGQIAPGLTIDHLCRVRKCVNPAHLEAVTQRENTLRSPIAVAAINARKTHCKRGHEFTPENTYTPRSGARICRACRKDYQRRKVAA